MYNSNKKFPYSESFYGYTYSGILKHPRIVLSQYSHLSGGERWEIKKFCADILKYDIKLDVLQIS